MDKYADNYYGDDDFDDDSLGYDDDELDYDVVRPRYGKSRPNPKPKASNNVAKKEPVKKEHVAKKQVEPGSELINLKRVPENFVWSRVPIERNAESVLSTTSVVGPTLSGKTTLICELVKQSNLLKTHVNVSIKDLVKWSDGEIDAVASRHEERTVEYSTFVLPNHYEDLGSPHHRMQLIDTPGCIEYYSSLMDSISMSDNAVIVLDVKEFPLNWEVLDNSKVKDIYGLRSLCMALKSLGTFRYTFALNKMETIDYDEGKYKSVVGSIQLIMKYLEIDESVQTFIPISCDAKFNIERKSSCDIIEEKAQWYTGPALFEQMWINHFDLLQNRSFNKPSNKGLLAKVIDVWETTETSAVGTVQILETSEGLPLHDHMTICANIEDQIQMLTLEKEVVYSNLKTQHKKDFKTVIALHDMSVQIPSQVGQMVEGCLIKGTNAGKIYPGLIFRDAYNHDHSTQRETTKNDFGSCLRDDLEIDIKIAPVKSLVPGMELRVYGSNQAVTGLVKRTYNTAGKIVRVLNKGSDGIVQLSLIGKSYRYFYDEAHTEIGQDTRRVFVETVANRTESLTIIGAGTVVTAEIKQTEEKNDKDNKPDLK